MSTNSKIEWTDHTFNPWIGCTKVSQEVTGGGGCDYCYAEVSTPVRVLRGKGIETWGAHAPRHRTSQANWALPRRWNDQHDAFFAQHGRRQRVFCASLADVFDNAVNPEWRRDLFALIAATPNLDWLLLTKRIGNAEGMIAQALCEHDVAGGPEQLPEWPWSNVWLGATVVNQAEADRDIPKLLDVPAEKRFLSMEPLLGPVSFVGLFANPGNPADGTNALEALDWMIVGGESGPGARPMHPNAARSLRDQCQAVGLPFFFKQWGEWVPYEHSAQPPFLWAQNGDEFDGHALPDFESGDYDATRSEWHMDWADMLLARKVGKKAAGRLLDGREWNEVPQ